MADVVYEMLAKISLDDSELKTGLNNAEQQINNSDLPEAAEKVNKRTAVAIYGTVYGAVAGVAGLTKLAVKAGRQLQSMAVDSAAYADTLLTNSVVTGLSTDQLQEYGYMAELVDVSVSTITGSVTKLTRTMAQARDGGDKQAEAFSRLGINVLNTDGTLRDANEVFIEAIEALGKIENATERDALSMEIFGRSAKDLNPLIAQGRAGIERFIREAHEMGYVLDNDTLQSLGALDDSLQRLANYKLTVRNRLGIVMAPSMERVLSKLIEIGNKIDWESIGEKLGNTLELAAEKLVGFVENVDFDKLLDGAMTLFDGVISGMSWILEHADEIVKLIRDIGIGIVLGKGAGVVSKATSGFSNLLSFGSKILGGGKAAAGAAATDAAAAAGPEVGAAVGSAASSSFWSTLFSGASTATMVALPGTLLAGLGMGIADYISARQNALAGATLGSDATIEQMRENVEAHRQLYEEARAFYESREFETWAMWEPDDGWQLSKATAQLDAAEAALKQAEEELAAAEEAQATATAATDAAADTSSTFADLITSAFGWGNDMMASMADGVVSGANSSLAPAIAGVATMIWSTLHHSEPEEGPLADDSTWMPDMMHGFAEGIRRGAPEVKSAVQDAFDLRAYTGFGVESSSGRAFGGVNVTVNVNGARYSDDESLAERISYELRQLFDREDMAYA